MHCVPAALAAVHWKGHEDELVFADANLPRLIAALPLRLPLRLTLNAVVLTKGQAGVLNERLCSRRLLRPWYIYVIVCWMEAYLYNPLPPARPPTFVTHPIFWKNNRNVLWLKYILKNVDDFSEMAPPTDSNVAIIYLLIVDNTGEGQPRHHRYWSK